ncbi:MAG: LysR family transcriptional regulator [Lachnospiraceae bacterium]|nr:LysR family transcriptional regulator [Lachnospiraceae bacterium]
MDINMELYKVFYYVAKTLSFSDAAARLYISQSAVSQSVKILEKRLNHTLFTRSTKRVTLTKEGEILFKHIEPAMNLIIRGENSLLNSMPSGGIQLRIAANDTICRYFLVPHLKDFHQRYPDVHINVVNRTSLQCPEMLDLDQVDIIITNSPNRALNNTVKIVPLREFRDVFIANKDAFPYEGQTLSFETLNQMPILMLDNHSTTSEYLHRIFQKHSLDLVPSIELSSNDLLIDLAKIGLGLAFVPDYCVSERGEDGLYIIRLEEELPARRLVAAYKDEKLLSQPAAYFLQHLTALR